MHGFFCFLFTIGGMIQAECMTVAYLFMCFSTLSTWLVVMMTFDRCVAVVKPFYHPKWRSIRSTGFIIGNYIHSLFLRSTYPTSFLQR